MPTQTIYFVKKPAIFSILFFFLGLCQSILLIIKLSAAFTKFDLAFLLLNIGLMISAILMHPKFNFTPRIEIGDEQIKFKPYLFSKPNLMPWSAVARINFKSYEIEFQLADGSSEIFVIPRFRRMSLDVKKIIGEISATKNIEVIRA